MAPAGNLEKLQYAVHYGADAVYIGGKDFSLRNRAANFSLSEMNEGTAFVHGHGKKIYLALNIFPHDADLKEMAKFLPQLYEIELDGIIVSDPGSFSLVRQLLPEVPIHISTQSNLLNSRTVRFWEEMGARRAVLARELSLEEITRIRQATSLELEVFVHGAMCMAYSGRCLLSSTLTGRDANRGDCAQPCRWEYTLSEEKRPGLFFPIVEEGGQSYVMNSKDLNLIRQLPELIAAGADSLKIEGRMKSLYYVAAVCRVYRDALDTYRQDPDGFRFQEIWWEELGRISHRDYTTGFLEDSADGEMQDTERGGYIQEYDFVGIVTERGEGKQVVVEARNKFHRDDRIEWIGPGMSSFTSTIEEIRDIDNAPLPFAQPEQTVLTQAPELVAPHFLLRRKRG